MADASVDSMESPARSSSSPSASPVAFNSISLASNNGGTGSNGGTSSNGGGACVLKKYYTCSAGDKERVVRCERDGCPKLIHRSCSLRVTEPFRDAAEPASIVCGKRCFNAITKGARTAGSGSAGGAAASPLKHEAGHHERKKRSPWNSDGPSPTVNSLSVLLGWLREPKNYSRWVNGGDQTKFETKAAIATQILALIKAKGIDTDRNRNDVFAKIYQLEKSFAEASEWVAANQHQLDQPALDAGAKKRCAYYSDLYPSMSSCGKGSAGHDISSRKRAAATEPDSADATKRQHVVASRDVRVHSSPVPPVKNQPVDVVVMKSVGTPERSAINISSSTTPPTTATITPAVLNQSLLASAASDSVSAAHLAALSASFMLANNPGVSASLSTPTKGNGTTPPLGVATTALLQMNNALLQAATDKLNAEAKVAAVAANAALLRARAALREEGVPQDEIDAVLPLEQ